jgi:hypothetical protein
VSDRLKEQVKFLRVALFTLPDREIAAGLKLAKGIITILMVLLGEQKDRLEPLRIATCLRGSSSIERWETTTSDKDTTTLM